MLAALDKFGFDITDYKIAEISKATWQSGCYARSIAYWSLWSSCRAAAKS